MGFIGDIILFGGMSAIYGAIAALHASDASIPSLDVDAANKHLLHTYSRVNAHTTLAQYRQFDVITRDDPTNTLYSTRDAILSAASTRAGLLMTGQAHHALASSLPDNAVSHAVSGSINFGAGVAIGMALNLGAQKLAKTQTAQDIATTVDNVFGNAFSGSNNRIKEWATGDKNRQLGLGIIEGGVGGAVSGALTGAVVGGTTLGPAGILAGAGAGAAYGASVGSVGHGITTGVNLYGSQEMKNKMQYGGYGYQLGSMLGGVAFVKAGLITGSAAGVVGAVIGGVVGAAVGATCAWRRDRLHNALIKSERVENVGHGLKTILDKLMLDFIKQDKSKHSEFKKFVLQQEGMAEYLKRIDKAKNTGSIDFSQNSASFHFSDNRFDEFIMQLPIDQFVKHLPSYLFNQFIADKHISEQFEASISTTTPNWLDKKDLEIVLEVKNKFKSNGIEYRDIESFEDTEKLMQFLMKS